MAEHLRSLSPSIIIVILIPGLNRVSLLRNGGGNCDKLQTIFDIYVYVSLTNWDTNYLIPFFTMVLSFKFLSNWLQFLWVFYLILVSLFSLFYKCDLLWQKRGRGGVSERIAVWPPPHKHTFSIGYMPMTSRDMSSIQKRGSYHFQISWVLILIRLINIYLLQDYLIQQKYVCRC